MNIEIANRLLELRKKHGLSQEQLADKLGISRQSVSKWERAEASPDTDNLLLLADLYGVSLDELLRGFDANKQDPQNTTCEETGKNAEKVYLGPDGIFVESEKDKVKVSWNGIHIEEDGKEKFHLSQKEGMRVDGEPHKAEDYVLCHKDEKKNPWQKFPFPIIAFAAMILWGWLGGAWHISWIAFLTVPLYYSFVDAVIKKNPQRFAFPVLAVIAYLLLGFYGGLWYIGWLVFFTVPIYYWCASAFKKDE